MTNNCQLATVNRQLSTVNCQPSTVNRQPSTVNSFYPGCTVFQLLYYFFDGVRPLFAPMSFIFAWGLIILVVWILWSAARDTVNTAKRMHQIPCSNCVFFTNDYRLKCTVNPSIANTEEAIGCVDHRPKLRD